ncbi:MAG: hypothetical protein R2838_04565 [Caldilineaceae bacterium]
MYYNPGVMKTVSSRVAGALTTSSRAPSASATWPCCATAISTASGQTGPFTVEGPFHVVDAAATQHVDQLLARLGGRWDYRTAQRWGFRMPWVTVWGRAALALLLATDAMPLDWDTCRPPTSAFIHSPTQRLLAATLVVVPGADGEEGHRTASPGAPWISWDAMSDAPDYLYVK